MGANGVSVARVAAAIGCSEDSVYKWASTNESNQFHLHNLIPLFAETGDFFILRELAGMFGFALTPMGNGPAAMLRAVLEALDHE
jgi:hypothetical protein